MMDGMTNGFTVKGSYAQLISITMPIRALSPPAPGPRRAYGLSPNAASARCGYGNVGLPAYLRAIQSA